MAPADNPTVRRHCHFIESVAQRLTGHSLPAKHCNILIHINILGPKLGSLCSTSGPNRGRRFFSLRPDARDARKFRPHYAGRLACLTQPFLRQRVQAAMGDASLLLHIFFEAMLNQLLSFLLGQPIQFSPSKLLLHAVLRPLWRTFLHWAGRLS